MALKDNKPRMYSTFWDVVSAAQQIATEHVDISEQPDFSNPVKYQGQIEMAILQAKAIIIASLCPLYSESDFRSASGVPWITIPVQNRRNQGDSSLISVEITSTLGATPYTAAWVATFSTSTVFGLFSGLEGAQSTTVKTGLSTVSDGTPNNLDFTVQAAAWYPGIANMVDGDQIWFSLIDVHPLIWQISNMIALSKALKEIYTAESPNLSEQGEDLYKKAMDLLNRLQQPDTPTGLCLTDLTSTLSPASTPVIYGVTFLGEDESPYLDRTGDSEYEI